ncbi:MAG: ABC transporter permease, partial [Solirubrobacteraceae bacterium]
VGVALVGTLGVVAILAPVLAPFDPLAIAGPSLQPPGAGHLLGPNDTGQDLLSQLIWGARSSMIAAVVAASMAVGLGVLVGAAAGLLRGAVDVVLMRVGDVFLAVPVLPLIILIAALAGPSRATVILVIGLGGWPMIARIVRSQTLTLSSRGYVEAARGLGATRRYMLRRHLVPALTPVTVASFVNWAATAVVLQAGLGFLGLSDPTEVSWGSIMNRALGHEGVYFTSQWAWWVLPPGLAVTAAAVGLAFLGLALEPRANPRMRRA